MHRSTIQISEARSMNAQCMFNGLGDGNEHVKRAKGLISKTTTSTFAVTGRLQRENAWFHVWRRKLSSDDEIFFLFLKSDMTLKKSTQGRIGLHFTTSASSNNRDEDWNNAKSLSKWHSCCRRRRGKLPIKMDLKLTYRLHGSGTNFWTDEFFTCAGRLHGTVQILFDFAVLFTRVRTKISPVLRVRWKRKTPDACKFLSVQKFVLTRV